MLRRIGHLGIAVKDLDAAVKIYRDTLGLELAGIEEVAEQKVRVAMFPVGESRLELLASTAPDGPIAKHIEKKGEGIQHVAFVVDDLEKTLAEFKARGVPLIDEKPRIGAGGHRIAFVHPKGTAGILVELTELDHA